MEDAFNIHRNKGLYDLFEYIYNVFNCQSSFFLLIVTKKIALLAILHDNLNGLYIFLYIIVVYLDKIVMM